MFLLFHIVRDMEGVNMLKNYMDVEHEALIRYVDRNSMDVNGIQRVMRIFSNVRNSVEYDNTTVIIQRASETLVMRRGNNASKNVLLCAVLKLNGFNCDVRYRYISDNTKGIAFRVEKIVPWFYVHVNYMGKEIELDCSLDKSFMCAVRVWHKGRDNDYSMKDYYRADGQAFEILSEEKSIDDVNNMDKFFNNVKDNFLNAYSSKCNPSYI